MALDITQPIRLAWEELQIDAEDLIFELKPPGSHKETK